MRIPPYWTRVQHSWLDRRGNEQPIEVCGWSFESLQAARRDGEERARRVAERLAAGGKLDQYDYLDRPLREEIVQSIDQDDREIGVITRNRYGSLVLNTASVCFVDVDVPSENVDPITGEVIGQPKGLIDAIVMIFSEKRRQERRRELIDGLADRIDQWYAQNRDHSLRLYRTAAGLRLLFTDGLYQPTSPEVDLLFDQLGSDDLYRQLTKSQECFRARLTPKPWRIGGVRPPSCYPWPTQQAEEEYRSWQQKYESQSTDYGVCELLNTFGTPADDETIAMIVRVHDKLACAGDGKPLA